MHAWQHGILCIGAGYLHYAYNYALHFDCVRVCVCNTHCVCLIYLYGYRVFGRPHNITKHTSIYDIAWYESVIAIGRFAYAYYVHIGLTGNCEDSNFLSTQ